MVYHTVIHCVNSYLVVHLGLVTTVYSIGQQSVYKYLRTFTVGCKKDTSGFLVRDINGYCKDIVQLYMHGSEAPPYKHCFFYHSN